jgi:hypothetical protein
VKRIIAVSLIVILSTLASFCIGTSLAESPITKKIWVWTPSEYAKVLRRYDISEKDIETILRVLECESNFQNIQSECLDENGNRELSFGIAQIHLPSHPDVTMEQALDEEFSINWTAKKWIKGFRTWSCY